MTFIKYTNDGKAVIQPAALTLSNLDNEDALEMHTLDNAIVLLKEKMTPLEKSALMLALMRLVNTLTVDMMTEWDEQEADGEDDLCGADFDKDIVAVPAEAFEDAGILHDSLHAFSTDGAVVILSENRKAKMNAELDRILKRYGIDRAGLDKLMKAVMEFDEDDD